MDDPDQLLDTGVLIDIYLGRERIRPIFDNLTSLRFGISVVSEAELWRGLRPGEHERHQALMAYFVALPVTSAVARLAGEWMQRYSARGLGWMDAFITATAAVEKLPLLTRDRRLAAVLKDEAGFVLYE